LVTDGQTRDRKNQSQGEIPGKPRRPYSCATDLIGPVMNPRAFISTRAYIANTAYSTADKLTPTTRQTSGGRKSDKD